MSDFFYKEPPHEGPNSNEIACGPGDLRGGYPMKLYLLQ